MCWIPLTASVLDVVNPEGKGKGVVYMQTMKHCNNNTQCYKPCQVPCPWSCVSRRRVF